LPPCIFHSVCVGCVCRTTFRYFKYFKLAALIWRWEGNVSLFTEIHTAAQLLWKQSLFIQDGCRPPPPPPHRPLRPDFRGDLGGRTDSMRCRTSTGMGKARKQKEFKGTVFFTRFLFLKNCICAFL
jgi:hypothetical protein